MLGSTPGTLSRGTGLAIHVADQAPQRGAGVAGGADGIAAGPVGAEFALEGDGGACGEGEKARAVGGAVGRDESGGC